MVSTNVEAIARLTIPASTRSTVLATRPSPRARLRNSARIRNSRPTWNAPLAMP